MPGSPTQLGPFAGGLNTLSDPTAVSDSELVDCINFELDLDGSLASRPPVVATLHGLSVHLQLLGYFISPTGAATLLASDAGTNPANGQTYRFDGTTWTAIASSPPAVAMVQYDDKAFLVASPDSAKDGGYWTPGGGFVAVPTMPKGRGALIYKERLFICRGRAAATNGSRLYFSPIANPAGAWGASDFLDVNRGDGQNIIDITLFNNSIVIFKSDSTYVYQYDSRPDRGTVSRLSATVGATDSHCVVPFENILFVYHEGTVYEFINYQYSRLNTKVPFSVSNAGLATEFVYPTCMSLVNDRLIVRYFDRTYVFNTKTRTWGRWDYLTGVGPSYFIQEPRFGAIDDVPAAVGSGALITDRSNYRIEDQYSQEVSEEMVCYLRTKNYDYQLAHHFKRLFWWGVDCTAQGEIHSAAYPIVYSATITFDQMDGVSFDVLDLGTWDQPLEAKPIIETDVSAFGAGSRKFIKFLKSLRFRQIYFEAAIETDGTARTAPVKVFKFLTVVGTKQSVSKQIS